MKLYEYNGHDDHHNAGIVITFLWKKIPKPQEADPEKKSTLKKVYHIHHYPCFYPQPRSSCEKKSMAWENSRSARSHKIE